jgi:hypothetical protein
MQQRVLYVFDQSQASDFQKKNSDLHRWIPIAGTLLYCSFWRSKGNISISAVAQIKKKFCVPPVEKFFLYQVWSWDRIQRENIADKGL